MRAEKSAPVGGAPGLVPVDGHRGSRRLDLPGVAMTDLPREWDELTARRMRENTGVELTPEQVHELRAARFAELRAAALEHDVVLPSGDAELLSLLRAAIRPEEASLLRRASDEGVQAAQKRKYAQARRDFEASME